MDVMTATMASVIYVATLTYILFGAGRLDSALLLRLDRDDDRNDGVNDTAPRRLDLVREVGGPQARGQFLDEALPHGRKEFGLHAHGRVGPSQPRQHGGDGV